MQTQETNNGEVAGFFVRLLALVVDHLITFVLPVILIGVYAQDFFRHLLDFYRGIDPWLIGIGIIAYQAIYSVLFLLKFQATPGKMLFGLKLKKKDQSAVGVLQLIAREVLGKYLSTVTLFVGYVMALVRSDKRALHDLLNETVVLKSTQHALRSDYSKYFKKTAILQLLLVAAVLKVRYDAYHLDSSKESKLLGTGLSMSQGVAVSENEAFPKKRSRKMHEQESAFDPEKNEVGDIPPLKVQTQVPSDEEWESIYKLDEFLDEETRGKVKDKSQLYSKKYVENFNQYVAGYLRMDNWNPDNLYLHADLFRDQLFVERFLKSCGEYRTDGEDQKFRTAGKLDEEGKRIFLEILVSQRTRSGTCFPKFIVDDTGFLDEIAVKAPHQLLVLSKLSKDEKIQQSFKEFKVKNYIEKLEQNLEAISKIPEEDWALPKLVEEAVKKYPYYLKYLPKSAPFNEDLVVEMLKTIPDGQRFLTPEMMQLAKVKAFLDSHADKVNEADFCRNRFKTFACCGGTFHRQIEWLTRLLSDKFINDAKSVIACTSEIQGESIFYTVLDSKKALSEEFKQELLIEQRKRVQENKTKISIYHLDSDPSFGSKMNQIAAEANKGFNPDSNDTPSKVQALRKEAMERSRRAWERSMTKRKK